MDASPAALPGLDALAPGAAALKRSYNGYLARGLVLAAVVHLLALGAYWAVARAAEEPLSERPVFVNVVPDPIPPPLAPAPPSPGAPPTAPLSGGNPIPIPDAEADLDATLPAQDEMVSLRDLPSSILDGVGGNGPEAGPVLPPSPPPTPPEVTPQPPVEPEEEFRVVEQMPAPVGGMEALQARIEYPEFARRAGIEGRVIVEFVVDKEGNPSDVHVLVGIGGGCDEAAVAAVQASRFTPGLQRGHAVKVRMSLPVTFRLN